MILTYNPNLAKVKFDPYAKCQGQRSNGSAVRAHTGGQTDGRTHARYQFYYLPRFAVDKNSIILCTVIFVITLPPLNVTMVTSYKIRCTLMNVSSYFFRRKSYEYFMCGRCVETKVFWIQKLLGEL